MTPIRTSFAWLGLGLLGLLAHAAPGQEAVEATAGLAGPQEALPRPVRPMSELGISARTSGGLIPPEHQAPLAWEGAIVAPGNRGWPIVEYHRAAAGSRSFPLYFEEVNAERYGYTCSRTLQPAISAAHFFGTIPYLPYLMTVNCPRECVYTLGHYRPGSCNPWRSHSFPYRLDAASMQGAAIAGLVFLLP